MSVKVTCLIVSACRGGKERRTFVGLVTRIRELFRIVRENEKEGAQDTATQKPRT